MMDEQEDVTEGRIAAIRAKPEAERTGEEQAIVGIDNALAAAREEFTKAGFELDHLILVFDADVSPDKNPESAMMGAVCEPDHPECAVMLLGGAIASMSGAAESVVRMIDTRDGGQSGPIHQQ